MTTHNVVNTSLSGTTGTVNFVGSNSPTFITPNIGAATSSLFTFAATTNGIIGTPTNDNASSGIVGELISSQNVTGVPIASVTATDLTSITLSAGDWDVFGNLIFNNTFMTGSSSYYIGWISSTSATLPDASLTVQYNGIAIYVDAAFPVLMRRFNVTTPTTVYISGYVSIITNTVTMGGNLYARRVR